MKNEKIKNSYIYSFNNNNEFLKDIIIINTKCLVDDKKNKIVYIDYNRLNDELSFYKYYSGQKKNFKNCLNIILPVILTNSNLERSILEATKLVEFYFYTMKDYFDYLFCSLAYCSLVYDITKNINITFEDILNNIKQQIILFEMKQEYKTNKINIIKFEKVRIECIQIIDKFMDKNIDQLNEDKIIINFLKTIYKIYIEDDDNDTDEMKSIKNSVYALVDFEIKKNISNLNFIESMANYIVKIRNFEIEKNKYLGSFDARELIKLNVGDEIVTPILNLIKVNEKKIEKDILHMKISSKSGIYNLKFKRN